MEKEYFVVKKSSKNGIMPICTIKPPVSPLWVNSMQKIGTNCPIFCKEWMGINGEVVEIPDIMEHDHDDDDKISIQFIQKFNISKINIGTECSFQNFPRKRMFRGGQLFEQNCFAPF